MIDETAYIQAGVAADTKRGGTPVSSPSVSTGNLTPHLETLRSSTGSGSSSPSRYLLVSVISPNKTARPQKNR